MVTALHHVKPKHADRLRVVGEGLAEVHLDPFAASLAIDQSDVIVIVNVGVVNHSTGSRELAGIDIVLDSDSVLADEQQNGAIGQFRRFRSGHRAPGEQHHDACEQNEVARLQHGLPGTLSGNGDGMNGSR